MREREKIVRALSLTNMLCPESLLGEQQCSLQVCLGKLHFLLSWCEY